MYIPACPYRYKYELVAWASSRFDKAKSYFNKMSKSQLYAIYYKAGRKQNERE